MVLGFAGTWALPLLTSLVAGDVFAAEDRLGTWRHLLVAVRSPRRIFAAKALASLTVILRHGGRAWPSRASVGGLAAVGNQAAGRPRRPAHRRGPQRAARCCSPGSACWPPRSPSPRSGLLGSVALGRSPMGLLLPALLAFVLQVAQLLPLPAAVRLALPSHAFLAWRGLFTEPGADRPAADRPRRSASPGPSSRRRWPTCSSCAATSPTSPTTGPGVGRCSSAVLPLAALVAVTVAVVAAATPATGSGIEQAKVEQSLATAFAHLYRLQSRELHRPDVTEAQLRTSASCDRAGSHGDDEGPGNDWRCVVSWHLPGATAVGTAIYQLDVTADGRYVADGDGPKEVNGYFQVRTPTGDAPNPLWQFDGLVDLLVTQLLERMIMQVTRQRRASPEPVPSAVSTHPPQGPNRRGQHRGPHRRRRRDRLRLDRRLRQPHRSARSTPTGSRSPTTRSSSPSATGS